MCFEIPKYQEQIKMIPILDKITCYGIVEVYNSKNIYIAADFTKGHYKLNIHSSYSTRYDGPIDSSLAHNTINFINNEYDCLFKRELGMSCGFYFSEILENVDLYRHYFFGADNYSIYNDITNEIETLRKFIDFFKYENKCIIEHFSQCRSESAKTVNIDLREPNNFNLPSEKEIFEQCLKFAKGIQQKDEISNEEWRLLQLQSDTNISKQDICAFLNITPDEIERRTKNIKEKIFLK